MHYFKREIGDYYKKAGRLGMLEHGACTLLTDACYDRERFPTMQEAIDWAWASTDSEIEAVKFVLARLFTLEDGLYVNEAIQKELDKYHANAKTNQRIAIEREAKKREKKTKGLTNSTKRAPSVNGSSDNQHESAPNHKPLTTNHKPLTNIKDLSFDKDEIEFLQNITNHWNQIMVTQPTINLLATNQVNKKRLSAIKKITKDYPDYKDHEYFEGHFNQLATREDFAWQRDNKQIGFDQATNLTKFSRNLDLMKMDDKRPTYTAKPVKPQMYEQTMQIEDF